MKSEPADRTGVLIVRLWSEFSDSEGLRARITQTLDTTGREQTITTTASADDIYDVVRTWVNAFRRST